MKTHIPFPRPWLACHVTRWHAGTSAPWLAHTQDRIGGHSGRMAALAMHIWQDCSRDLLAACICHDLGECVAGDAPAPAKRDGTLRSALDRIEAATLAEMGMGYGLSLFDAHRLKFLDRLDAYLWAQLHAPQILDRPDWKNDLIELKAYAFNVGAEDFLVGAA